MTIDPKTLNAAERAIWDQMALDYWKMHFSWSCAYSYSRAAAIEAAKARRALFSPAQPEPKREEVCRNCGAKVEQSFDHWEPDQPPGGPPLYFCKPAPSPAPACRHCEESPCMCAGGPSPAPVVYACPNCGKRIDYEDQHLVEGDSPHVSPHFSCKPAQVAGELASEEIPKPLVVAVQRLRAHGYNTDALESWARSQATAQPVAVGMTPELEMVLSVAEGSCGRYESAGYKDAPKSWRAAIAAVRAQAASAQPKAVEVPVEAIRSAIVMLRVKDNGNPTAATLDRWLAAVKGGK